MVFYRALQGFTGGVIIPISFTVANTMLPPGSHLARRYSGNCDTRAGGWALHRRFADG